MNLNKIEGKVYINKDIYPEKEIRNNEGDKTIEKVPFVDASFRKNLEEKCSPDVRQFIKKDKFIEHSLLSLMDHHQKTFDHSVEVGNIAAYIAKRIKNSELEGNEENIIATALLHDYGKLAIDKKILDKRSKLKPEEMEIIKQHVLYSFKLVNQVNDLWAKVIIAHHEFQKDSYPRSHEDTIEREKREADVRVKRLARILAMIDTYEAMIDDRPGNPSKSIKQINVELNKQFISPSDQEVIFLLKQYYMEKNPDNKIDAVFN